MLVKLDHLCVILKRDDSKFKGTNQFRMRTSHDTMLNLYGEAELTIHVIFSWLDIQL